jgi:hypothetical protein
MQSLSNVCYCCCCAGNSTGQNSCRWQSMALVVAIHRRKRRSENGFDDAGDQILWRARVQSMVCRAKHSGAYNEFCFLFVCVYRYWWDRLDHKVDSLGTAMKLPLHVLPPMNERYMSFQAIFRISPAMMQTLVTNCGSISLFGECYLPTLAKHLNFKMKSFSSNVLSPLFSIDHPIHLRLLNQVIKGHEFETGIKLVPGGCIHISVDGTIQDEASLSGNDVVSITTVTKVEWKEELLLTKKTLNNQLVIVDWNLDAKELSMNLKHKTKNIQYHRYDSWDKMDLQVWGNTIDIDCLRISHMDIMKDKLLIDKVLMLSPEMIVLRDCANVNQFQSVLYPYQYMSSSATTEGCMIFTMFPWEFMFGDSNI